jgi:hypothetical protein
VAGIKHRRTQKAARAVRLRGGFRERFGLGWCGKRSRLTSAARRAEGQSATMA